MRVYSKSINIVLLILLVLASSVFDIRPAAAATTSASPKLATIYLGSPLNEKIITQLASFDVVVLHMLDQVTFSKEIKELRRRKPSIILLAYVPSEEFPIANYKQWEPNPNGLWHKLLAGITPEMWLVNEKKEHVIFWGSNWMLNASNYATTNKRWNEYLANFVNSEILSTGLWDGIFYDNTWTGVSWIQNGAIDANRDGVNDQATVLDDSWQAGMHTLFTLTRQKAGKPIVLVGNGDRGYYSDLNGLYIENFTAGQGATWAERMRLYAQATTQSQAPAIAVVGNTAAAQTDYARMRFGLASALMHNGYYAFDRQDSHAEIWWYDEYATPLGAPLSPAIALSGTTAFTAGEVWRRDFAAGIALANPTGAIATVDLGGEYEKIIGVQDPLTNDGSIVSSVSLNARDGLLMLKTFQSVSNTVFSNGSFVRFYTLNGSRVRNGFFLYEQNLAGGAKIYNGDLDSDGMQEKIVATGPKLEIFNSRGQRWFDGYPFGANYKGTLQIAVAPLTATATPSIIVAPSSGKGNVVVYTYFGELTSESLYPLGKKYARGFSVAVGKTGAQNQPEIIVGTQAGVQTEVLYINPTSGKIRTRFAPFGRTSSGSSVAAGDFNGDGIDEVAATIGTTRQPLVRVFNSAGKKISEFKVSGVLSQKPFTLAAAGITSQGKKEIVVFTND